MKLPIDRGLVVVSDEADGTQTIHICADIRNGEPVDVFASHNRADRVRVQEGVTLTRRGQRSFSTQILEVFDEEGVVNIQRVSTRG
ncbi:MULTISPECIES: hypothetical protein [Micromonospora]|uniref:Uncharacterized protein n=1 Tax=Micromonospora rubida TaxID=2697657 RepID=A0ABW7SFC9_9ACTN|nr:hypothetical protein [Micromonospora rubida]NBE80750.1 hypothetical protein [Micromonospora rubida]